MSSYYRERLSLYSALCELTYTCNLKCFHCYNTHQNIIEQDFSFWSHTLDQLADLGCLHLTLSGGEPLLNKNFSRILEYAKKKHFALTIFSNATLINRTLALEWSRLGVLEVSTSLFSAHPLIHDSITGKTGSHAQTLRGIEILVEQGLRVRVKCLLIKSNFDTYPEVADLCETMGVDLSFDTTLMPGGGNNTSLLNQRLTPEQLKKALADPLVLHLSGNPLEYDGGHPAGPVENQHQLLCGAGITFLSINPYGDVYTCVQQQKPLGNLKLQSLQEIWESSVELNNLRNRQVSDLHTCASCQHNTYCGRCPALAEKEDGDHLGPSSHACQTSKVLHEIFSEKLNIVS